MQRIALIVFSLLFLATPLRAGQADATVSSDLDLVATQMGVEILGGHYENAISMGAPWVARIDTLQASEGKAIFGVLNGLAYAYVKMNRLREAKETADLMLQLLSSNGGGIADYGFLSNIYDTFVAIKDYDRAEKLIKKKMELQKQSVGGDSHEIAFTLADLADLYERKGDKQNAEETYLLAFTLMTNKTGPVEYAAAMLAEKIARFYKSLGKVEKSTLFVEKAQGIRLEYDKANAR